MPKKKQKEGQASQPATGAQVSPPAEERPFQPIEVQVGKLWDALALVEPAVPRKTTLPVTQNIRLGEGKVVATDLEVAITAALPEAQDAVLLPHKGALEFLKYAPGHETARIIAEKGGVAIAVGGMETRFKVPAAEDFPPIPAPKSEHEGVLDGDALVRALAAVAPCAAAEDTRPVLTGVCLTPGDQVEAAAGDGFRLAWETIPGRLPGDGNLIMPARAVAALEHLWKKATAPDLSGASDPARIALAKRLIRLDWGKDRLQMRFGEVSLMVKLIQGTFPNYRQLIPSQRTGEVTVLAEEMERALRQLAAVAKEGSGIVRLTWEGDRLLLSARAEEVGETAVPVPATCAAPGRVAMNVGLLLGYFKDRPGMVTISLSAEMEKGIVLFTHRGTPHVCMMPMFVQW